VVHNWVENFSQGRSKVAHDETEGGIGWDDTRKTLCCWFRLTGKAMGQVYQCWWRICGDMFFPGSNITCFMFYIHFWPIYWLPHSSSSSSNRLFNDAISNLDDVASTAGWRWIMNWKGCERKL
jgi:hypothetical protein